MPHDEQRLSVDQGVDLIDHAHGLPLSREVLVDICESGWHACRHEGQSGWTIDAAGASGDGAARELMERVARLASERQDAEESMLEQPEGAEADEDI